MTEKNILVDRFAERRTSRFILRYDLNTPTNMSTDVKQINAES